MNMKEACEIVYARLNICKHEWFEGRCIHCELTPDWSRAVRELNAKLGVEHNRTVDAERKNKNLLAEVADEERWMREVLTDFRIPFDDHKIGRRMAFTQWMAERKSANDKAQRPEEI